MKRLIFFLFLSSFLISPATAEPLRAFHGSRSLVKAKHLIPVLKEGEGYGEKYTFDADFGERGSFYFSLAISNLGIGDHKMDARGRLTIDGKKFKWKKSMDEDEWSFDKKGFSIKAGPAKISGTPKKLKLEVKKGKKALEFSFTPIAQAWRPRNGQIQYGKERKRSDFTLFPLMKVKGRYKMDGSWKEIEGIGYGSRTWSELAVYEQNRWNLQFRGIDGESTIYLREIGATSDYNNKRAAYLLITKGSEIVIESFNYKFKTNETYTDGKHENRYKVPESFSILGVDAEEKGRKFRGKFTKKKLKRRKDLLADMNSAVRMVAERYSKPVRYDYKTKYLIEVKTKKEMLRFKGIGDYEVYHWNK